MPQQQAYVFNSLTDFFVLVHLGFAAIGIVLGLPFVVFGQTIEQLVTALYVGCTCFWMFGIVKLMKNVVVYIHKRHNTEELERCRNQMIIGFGGTTLCGIISSIAIFYVENPYVMYYSIITCLVTSVIFYTHFCEEFQETWRVNYKTEYYPLISTLLAIQITVLIITMKIAYDNYDNPFVGYYNPLINLGFRQFYILVLSASSIIDIGVVLAGGLEKKNDVKLEVVEIVQPSASGEFTRLECKICMEEYSETVIPRILKECGHTICEKCAEHFLEKNNRQHLFCPFCQGVTVVKGPASLLPKNFAIINTINEKM